MSISIFPLGDNGIKVHFQQEVTSDLSREIQLFCQKLTDFPVDGVMEWVPAYNSIGIYYDFRVISYKKLIHEINHLYDQRAEGEVYSRRLIYVPVVYGGAYGPDLRKVADYNNCSEPEVTKMHQEQTYLVHMIGFLPGFPYLRGMTTKIATPRLENPRDKIVAGSVGIADQQTGIYPLASPGGWNIIGRTPIRLFDLKKEHACLFQAGDYVKFQAVTSEEFLRIKELAEKGSYEAKVESLDGDYE